MSKEQLPVQSIEDVLPDSYPPEVEAYFAHYELDVGPGIQHWFGSFPSGNYTLVAHIYRPARYEAAVIGLHGYMNHAGQLKHVIRPLLEQGFAVALFDLPGHGLSSGPSARIDSVEEYTQAVSDFMKIIRPRLHGPYHALGFSLGAGILVDLLLTGRAESFEKIILAAPLIRWTAYRQSKDTYKVYSKFTNKIPRFSQKNSSDREYLVFNKTEDYLQATHVSLPWVKALFDWNEKVTGLPVCEKEILILQGDKDATVDWQYNLELLGKKFPHAEIEILHKARHELFNETLNIRNSVLNYIQEYLK